MGRAITHRWMVAVALGSLLLFGSVSPTLAAASQTATECHDITGAAQVPTAPTGEWYVVTTTLTSNCTLSVSSPVLTANPPASLSGASQATASLTAGPAPASGDPEVTSYYRLWDCCGNDLNATYDTLNWSTSSGRVTGANETLHSVWYNDGWKLNYQNPGWNGGCVGCTSITSLGTDNFEYTWAPFFDNWDYVGVVGNGNGTSHCNATWWWAVGFPGWHTQTWCGSGYNP